MRSSFVQTRSPLKTASDSSRGMTANRSRTTDGEERPDRFARLGGAVPAAGAPDARP